jgi:hypothetical protein
MNEMVERVAKAICNATREFDWDSEDESLRTQFRNEAIAAIQAMREPTPTMTYLASWAVGPGGDGAKKAVLAKAWRAMIDAALKEG